jgi:hypothetical protein
MRSAFAAHCRQAFRTHSSSQHTNVLNSCCWSRWLLPGLHAAVVYTYVCSYVPVHLNMLLLPLLLLLLLLAGEC